MSVLSPNIYKENVKWKLNNKSKIDTVVYEPILNSIGEQTLYTESITTLNVRGSNVSLSSVYNNTSSYGPQIIHAAKSEGKDIHHSSSHEQARGRVDVLFGRYEKIITLSSPIANKDITIDLAYSIKTDYIGRGNKTLASIPTWSNLTSIDYNLATWIKNNKSSTVTDDAKWSWNSPTFPFNPFIRIPTAFNNNIVIPDASDVLTKWYTGTSEYPGVLEGGNNYGARASNWSEYVQATASHKNYYNKEAKNLYFQNPEYVGDPIGRYEDKKMLTPYYGYRCLNIENCSIVPAIRYQIVDTLSLKIILEVPIRISYVAASGGYKTILNSSWEEIDNYAFVDYVTNINMTVKGNTISSESTKIIYKLNTAETDVVTVGTKGTFDYVINKNELVTIDSKWNPTNDALTKKLAKDLLLAYKQGKMTFECEVDAEWMINNNIQLNDYIHVLDRDNKVITKNENIVTFKIRNINKHYEQGSFIYSIQLSECSNEVTIVSIKMYNGEVYHYFVTNDVDLDQIASYFQLQFTRITDITVSGVKHLNISHDFLNGNDYQDPYDIYLATLNLGYTSYEVNQITLGNDSFRDCLNLKAIDIRNCQLKDRVFYSCLGLKVVKINSKTQFNGVDIFFDCNNIEKLYFEGTAIEFQTFDFGNSQLEADQVYVLDENGNWIPYDTHEPVITIEIDIRVGSVHNYDGSLYNYDINTRSDVNVVETYNVSTTQTNIYKVDNNYKGLRLNCNTSYNSLEVYNASSGFNITEHYDGVNIDSIVMDFSESASGRYTIVISVIDSQ